MLRLENINKTFNRGTINETSALSEVSLHVPPGSFVVLLGGNGSGKSTLQNVISGACAVDSGLITLEQQNITAWPEHRRACLIGRVFQNPFLGTAAKMSIIENFALASRRGLSRGLEFAVDRRFRYAVQEVVGSLKMGLENRLDQAIGALSGGQRQALTLLMATWRKPSLLMLDEHTAALDPKTADQVMKLTNDIVNRNKLTTLMVTHSMHQAVSTGDRLLLMHRGRVAYDFQGSEKARLRVSDLLNLFEEIRGLDLFDESAAAFLRESYI